MASLVSLILTGNIQSAFRHSDESSNDTYWVIDIDVDMFVAVVFQGLRIFPKV